MGLRYPLNYEMRQMTAFLSSLVTPPELKGQPAKNTSDVIGAVLRRTFYFADDTNADHKARKYMRFADPELDRIMEKHGLIEPHSEQGKDISYYALRDLFHSLNEIRGRTLAHRYAMPTIGDMIETLSDSSILDVWSDVHIDNERALDFWRIRLWLHKIPIQHSSITPTLTLVTLV